jgi:hypothetical protein
MHIHEIVENDGVGWLFHGTSLRNLQSIIETGIVPAEPPDYCWPEFDDMLDDDDSSLPPEAFEKRAFFTESFRSASEYAGNYNDGIVLRVPFDCANFGEGETDEPYYFTRDTVPPSVIQAFVNKQWIQISGL